MKKVVQIAWCTIALVACTPTIEENTVDQVTLTSLISQGRWEDASKRLQMKRVEPSGAGWKSPPDLAIVVELSFFELTDEARADFISGIVREPIEGQIYTGEVEVISRTEGKTGLTRRECYGNAAGGVALKEHCADVDLH